MIGGDAKPHVPGASRAENACTSSMGARAPEPPPHRPTAPRAALDKLFFPGTGLGSRSQPSRTHLWTPFEPYASLSRGPPRRHYLHSRRPPSRRFFQSGFNVVAPLTTHAFAPATTQNPPDSRTDGDLIHLRREEPAMSDLFWLSNKQLRRIEPYFPLSHGMPRR
jgi:hypothetical protein